jgi:hypothetical protein
MELQSASNFNGKAVNIILNREADRDAWALSFAPPYEMKWGLRDGISLALRIEVNEGKHWNGKLEFIGSESYTEAKQSDVELDRLRAYVDLTILESRRKGIK